jgi:hypothetical protein
MDSNQVGTQEVNCSSETTGVRSYATALYMLGLGFPVVGAELRAGGITFRFATRDVSAGLKSYHQSKAVLDALEQAVREGQREPIRTAGEGGAR